MTAERVRAGQTVASASRRGILQTLSTFSRVFIFISNQTQLQQKGFAVGLVLKQTIGISEMARCCTKGNIWKYLQYCCSCTNTRYSKKSSSFWFVLYLYAKCFILISSADPLHAVHAFSDELVRLYYIQSLTK